MTTNIEQALLKGAFFPHKATKDELIAKFWDLHNRLTGLRRHLQDNGIDADAVEARALEEAENKLDEDWRPVPLPLDSYIKRALEEYGSNRARLQFLLDRHIEDALKLLEEHGFITWGEQERIQGDSTVMVVI